jgi:hypothetical protein
MEHRAYWFATEVGAGGKVELTVPLPRGARVEVVVLTEPVDEFGGLRRAATETVGCWNNPEMMPPGTTSERL